MDIKKILKEAEEKCSLIKKRIKAADKEKYPESKYDKISKAEEELDRVACLYDAVLEYAKMEYPSQYSVRYDVSAKIDDIRLLIDCVRAKLYRIYNQIKPYDPNESSKNDPKKELQYLKNEYSGDGDLIEDVFSKIEGEITAECGRIEKIIQKTDEDFDAAKHLDFVKAHKTIADEIYKIFDNERVTYDGVRDLEDRELLDCYGKLADKMRFVEGYCKFLLNFSEGKTARETKEIKEDLKNKISKIYNRIDGAAGESE